MLNNILLLSTLIPYIIFSIWALIAGYNVTKTDPVDPVLYASEKYQKKMNHDNNETNITIEKMPLSAVHQICYDVTNDQCQSCNYSIYKTISCLCISCIPRCDVNNAIECNEEIIAEQHKIEGNEFCYYCQVCCFIKHIYIIYIYIIMCVYVFISIFFFFNRS